MAPSWGTLSSLAATWDPPVLLSSAPSFLGLGGVLFCLQEMWSSWVVQASKSNHHIVCGERNFSFHMETWKHINFSFGIQFILMKTWLRGKTHSQSLSFSLLLSSSPNLDRSHLYLWRHMGEVSLVIYSEENGYEIGLSFFLIGEVEKMRLIFRQLLILNLGSTIFWLYKFRQISGSETQLPLC